jgi:ribonuclease PH
MNVVMTGSGQLVEVQATAEGKPYTVAELNRLVDVARPGIEKLIELQRSILGLEIGNWRIEAGKSKPERRN